MAILFVESGEGRGTAIRSGAIDPAQRPDRDPPSFLNLGIHQEMWNFHHETWGFGGKIMSIDWFKGKTTGKSHIS